MSLGEKIRKLRLSKDITQKELADQLNVSFQTVSKWENNINEPDLASLKKIANIFNCPIDFFFEDDEEKINNSLEVISKENESKEVKEETKEEIKEEVKKENRPKRTEYISLKEDEDLDSEGNIIKKEVAKEEKKEFRVNEVTDYSNVQEVEKEIEESHKTILINKKKDDEPLEIVGYCATCLKPVINSQDYYETTKIGNDGKTKKEYFCEECYLKSKEGSSNKIGTCKDCGVQLYKNDDYFKIKRPNIMGGESEVLLCEECYKEYLRTRKPDKNAPKISSNSSRAKSKSSYGNKQKKTYSSISLRNDSTVIKWSLILGFIALASTLGVCIYNYNIVGLGSTIILPILFGYMVLSTIYCLFSQTYISEVFAAIAGKVIHFPGLIFEFSLDGIAWLIGMKILFAVIGFLAGLAFILLATFVAIILSFFSYLPLLSYNKTHYESLKD